MPCGHPPIWGGPSYPSGGPFRRGGASPPAATSNARRRGALLRTVAQPSSSGVGCSSAVLSLRSTLTSGGTASASGFLEQPAAPGPVAAGRSLGAVLAAPAKAEETTTINPTPRRVACGTLTTNGLLPVTTASPVRQGMLRIGAGGRAFGSHSGDGALQTLSCVRSPSAEGSGSARKR